MTRKDRIPYLLKGQNWRGDVTDMRASARRLWKRLKAGLLRRRAKLASAREAGGKP